MSWSDSAFISTHWKFHQPVEFHYLDLCVNHDTFTTNITGETLITLFFPPSSPLSLTYDVFDGKGESTPLVFLHGLFGSKSNFHSIAKSLVQRTGRKVMQWWRHHTCLLLHRKQFIFMCWSLFSADRLRELVQKQAWDRTINQCAARHLTRLLSSLFVINTDRESALWRARRNSSPHVHNTAFVCAVTH